MEIRETSAGDVVVLELDGRLDTKTSHLLEKKLLDLMGEGKLRIVVDMASLQYLSSAGLRVLLMLGKKLNAAENGNLALCSMNENVREVFDIAGFTAVFTIENSRAEALASFPSGARAGKAERVAERAAHSMGVDETGTGMPQVDREVADLALRAARLLGAKVD
jgi:anti-sigma B factor antagonist